MEQRRTRRFQLQLPLSITRSGAVRVELAGRTRNISSSGVLFTTEREPRSDAQMVNLRCMGKIVRADGVEPGREEASPAYRVAATLERYEFVRDS